MLDSPTTLTSTQQSMIQSMIDAELINAIRAANYGGVLAALQAGANVNHRDPNSLGQSPLIQSATYLRPAFEVTANVQQALLDAGADVHQTDDRGASPLEVAALFEHWALCERMIEAGARAWPMDTVPNGATPPIVMALSKHQTSLVRRLLEAGASIPHTWGENPMMLEVFCRLDRSAMNDEQALELLNLMLEHTPAPVDAMLLNIVTNEVIKALDAPLTTERLLSAGASCTTTLPPEERAFGVIDDQFFAMTAQVTDWTVVHEAALHNRVQSLRVLLDAGANVEQRATLEEVSDKEHWKERLTQQPTALDMARFSQAQEALVVLEQAALQRSMRGEKVRWPSIGQDLPQVSRRRL